MTPTDVVVLALLAVPSVWLVVVVACHRSWRRAAGSAPGELVSLEELMT